MVIDHIGIAVKSIDKAVDHWKKNLCYEPLTEMVVNTRQKVKVVFMTKADSLTIKIIEPTDESSPIYRFVRKGGGLHHLCFKCEKLDDQLKQLSDIGIKTLVPPQPGEAFENEDIAFVYGGFGLNMELIDTDKRANKL